MSAPKDPVKREAWLQKLREANLGKKHSEETKLKVSAAAKRMWAEMPGEERQRLSAVWSACAKQQWDSQPEERKKLVGRNCVRVWGEGSKQKISEAHTGLKHTDEAKHKISEASRGNQYLLGYKHTEEARRKMSEKRVGREVSEETRRKLSLAKKGVGFPPEFGRKVSAALRKYWETIPEEDRRCSEEHKIAVSIATKLSWDFDSARKEKYSERGKAWWTSERIEALRIRSSEIMSAKWQDPEWRAKTLENIMRGLALRPTKPEKVTEKLLEGLFPAGGWEYVGAGTLCVGGKFPDFINKDCGLIVEVYGDYWHRNDDPQERIDHFRKFGYDTLVVWESELKDVGAVADRILEFAA